MLLERVRRAYRAGQAAAADATVATPEPAADQAGPGCVMLIALGDEAGDFAALTDALLAAARKAGTRAVLVSSRKLAIDAAHPGLICEHLPEPADISAVTGDRHDVVLGYLARRLRIMLDKWSVSDCLWSGTVAEALVARLSSGPGVTNMTCRFRKHQQSLQNSAKSR